MDGLESYLGKKDSIVYPKFKNQSVFTIKHTASNVMYETNEFILKNKNEVYQSLNQFINSCKSEV